MKVFISILIAIYIIWSLFSFGNFLTESPYYFKCCKITNIINLFIIAAIILSFMVALLATIVYGSIWE